MRLSGVLFLRFFTSFFVVAGVEGEGEGGGEGSNVFNADDNQHQAHPPGSIYQDKHGFLCVDGDCFDADFQADLIKGQLEIGLQKCEDHRSWCQSRVAECSSSTYVQAYCPKTCKVCHNRTRTVSSTSKDTTKYQPNLQQQRRLEQQFKNSPKLQQKMDGPSKRKSRRKIVQGIGSDIGVPQLVTIAEADDIRKIVERARDYVHNKVMVDDRYLTVREKCVNEMEECALWAAQGWCDDGEDDDMLERCAPVCQSCEGLHYVARCPLDQNTKNAWYPGDLNAMFERIVNNPDYQRDYNVTILSRPSYAEGDSADTANYQIGPWLITLENFTRPEEAQKLIDLGGLIGYERSEDVGDEDESGNVDSIVSTGRTSMNAWCYEDKCESDPVVENVVRRMEDVTGIHRNYSEYMQLLRYEKDQFYERHHDYIEIDRLRYTGARILTVFLYLNDVEEGGETDFPELGLSVKPKLGRAVLWPSVLDEDPHMKDFRTDHQALPVLKGVKYGANAWFHQRNFRAGFADGC